MGLVNHTSVGPEGATPAMIMLKTPKIKPTTRPETGPTITAAMITGTCIMVNDTPPNQGMNPQCVQPNNKVMAAIRAVITRLRVFLNSFIKKIPLFYKIYTKS
jgi:hypothetical protein